MGQKTQSSRPLLIPTFCIKKNFQMRPEGKGWWHSRLARSRLPGEGVSRDLGKGGTAEVGGVEMLPNYGDRENSAHADQWVI